MIGVLVSGTGTNLQALLDAELPVSAVASNTPDAHALDRAEEVGIATAAFELEDYPDRTSRDEAMADWLGEHAVELVVLAGYMHLLTPAFLKRFPDHVVNVHPSLLPAFPGTHAVADQLAAGVTESGATVHVVDEGIDTGPVLLQERVPVEPGDTVETLHARIKGVEHQLLPRAVRMLLAQGVT
jgi:phosphoribosylglycinamide formyltransferase-1